MVEYRELIKQDTAKEFAVRDEYLGLSVEELQKIQAAQTYPFSVCLLNVTGELNVGTVIRTACTMGAEEVILFGRRRYDKRSAVNAWAYQKLTRIDGLLDDDVTIDCQKFWNFLEEGNYLPIFCETGGITLNTVTWKSLGLSWADRSGKKLLLVFGTEGTGIPPELLKNETVISIPQRGVLRSMNVSNAAAIIMWDLKSKMGWM